MTTTIITVSSSYLSAHLSQRGHRCKLQPKPQGGDRLFLFQDSKARRADIAIFEQDVDLVDFIAAHRALKWEVKTARAEERQR